MGASFIIALGLVLIVEGIVPLVFPTLWKDTFRRITLLENGQLRFIGLAWPSCRASRSCSRCTRSDVRAAARPGPVPDRLIRAMPAWSLPEAIADILPAEARRIETLRRSLLDLYASYGYELVMPPLLEYVESLLSGTGRDLDLQMFKLVDQMSGRTMGLRADITPQVARIDAHLLNRAGVTRLCYAGSVLYTRPRTLTGTREPFVVGAELYGHGGIEADLEIQDLLLATFAAAGVADVRIDLGHAEIVRADPGRRDRSTWLHARRTQSMRCARHQGHRGTDARRPAASRPSSRSGDLRGAACGCNELNGGIETLRRSASSSCPNAAAHRSTALDDAARRLSDPCAPGARRRSRSGSTSPTSSGYHVSTAARCSRRTAPAYRTPRRKAVASRRSRPRWWAVTTRLATIFGLRPARARRASRPSTSSRAAPMLTPRADRAELREEIALLLCGGEIVMACGSHSDQGSMLADQRASRRLVRRGAKWMVEPAIAGATMGTGERDLRTSVANVIPSEAASGLGAR